MSVLVQRASAHQIPLLLTPDFSAVQPRLGEAHTPLGLAGHHQQKNASLAVSLCELFLQRTGRLPLDPQMQFRCSDSDPPVTYSASAGLPGTFATGLRSTHWAGRGQIIQQPRLTWYLDGAHTAESTLVCREWYVQAAQVQSKRHAQVIRVLLFNCREDKTPERLLQPLMQVSDVFDHVVFCAYSIGSLLHLPADSRPAESTVWQQQLRDIWTREQQQQQHVKPAERVQVLSSTAEFMEWLRKLQQRSPDSEVEVLVTGSLYLVGGMLATLGCPP
eukprot:TRINITY_DN6412_c0_g1_i1.p1 TRINITY_DN6412_c0_g1~~TRINITY_DN6412_c0_g1_i1.p1  ORF type:complete len:275 (-),score=53.17 TRINITY_DN6412_c0_g1_i1:258-1082(-)